MIEIKEFEKTLLKDYKFIDLFCGIGGFHVALEAFGAECVFASDVNEEAKNVYKKNFGILPYGDITKISSIDIPSHDILCGGFPCQAFSISGKGKGFSDCKTGQLFFEINRILKDHKPKVVFLENVANLEKHWGGYSLKNILNALKSRGYKPFEKVLNAIDYGIPQHRKRLYIVAFREDLSINDFNFPKPLETKKSLKDFLEDKVDERYYIKQNYKIRDDVLDIEKDRQGSYIRVGEVGPGRQGERIYSVNGCATTLSSSSGGPGGRTGMYYINNKVRKLTPRECARLMGFPNDFKIAESDNQAYLQFGNSVVIDVLQYILLEIISKIQGE